MACRGIVELEEPWYISFYEGIVGAWTYLLQCKLSAPDTYDVHCCEGELTFCLSRGLNNTKNRTSSTKVSIAVEIDCYSNDVDNGSMNYKI